MVGGYQVWVRVVGKSADIPEQYKFSDVIKYNGIRFNCTAKELMDINFEPWLNLRKSNAGVRLHEPKQITTPQSTPQSWCLPRSVFEVFSHNTKNFAEQIGTWISLQRLSAVKGRIFEFRMAFICAAFDAIQQTTKCNRLSYEGNVKKGGKTQIALAKFLLEPSTNFIAVLPIICYNFFCFEDSPEIQTKRNYKQKIGNYGKLLHLLRMFWFWDTVESLKNFITYQK